MKHGTVLLASVAVVLIAVGVAFALRPDPIAVETETVTLGTVTQTVTNTRAGTLKACQRARLAPPAGGQIARLPVKKGDRVKRGDVLLELWNDDIRAQLAVAQRDAVASQARAEEACVAARVSGKEADRLEGLRERKLVSAEIIDRAQGEAEQLAAGCRAATQNISVARARVDQAQATLERTWLRAPFDGVVAEINGELGEFVTPSPVGIPTPPAVDVVDTRCVYVTAPIDEVDAPRIREGMRARVTLDAFRDREFPAKVRRVAPYVLDVEKQARTVEVEAELEPLQNVTLLPGYSADVEVLIEQHDEVLRVPSRAVIEGGRVYVFDPEDDRVHSRQVDLGVGNWEYTEVRRGLKAGDQVVTTIDREGLADGVPARITKPRAP
jgi:HlyD family secretion protein